MVIFDRTSPSYIHSMTGRRAADSAAAIEADAPAIELGDLAESLSFHMKRTDALVFQHFNRRIPRSRMVRGVVAIMMLVRTNPGLNQDAVGRSVGLDKSTISAAIAKLKDRKLIEQRSSQDKRVRHLYLTPSGRDFLKRMVPLVDLHEIEIAAGLSLAERETLIALLDRVFLSVARLEGA
jgi:DNA-binding MarR family transcriptional regulator